MQALTDSFPFLSAFFVKWVDALGIMQSDLISVISDYQYKSMVAQKASRTKMDPKITLKDLISALLGPRMKDRVYSRVFCELRLQAVIAGCRRTQHQKP